MKTTIINIKKGEMMKDIVPLIQSNTIYDKFIPGIGATTLEIEAERNSILILPFLPVIEGKKYDKQGNLREDILGLYGEMNKEYITQYIEKREGKTKKILCTPEKFKMVLEAIREQGEDPYKDYFLLLDECETIIKDVDYRPDIKLPLLNFFRFENKAMISATPIVPRDIRFEKQKFNYVKIRPAANWTDYKIPLDLKGTNNVVSVLRSFIKSNPDETICIFTNCSKTITKIISDLKIEKEAKVFCSYRLYIKRFKVTGVKHTYTSLKHNKDGLAKVNFFTSRFFCAVDMIFPNFKPIVVMVTNVYYSDHSKIDPDTDAIQISGRFRKGINKEVTPAVNWGGIKKIVHISNFNTDIPLRTKVELKAEVDELVNVYRFLNRYKSEPGSNESRVKWINQIFQEPPFIKMITEGKLDTYLADNFQHQKQVDSYYSNFLKLKSAYLKTNYFIVNASYTSLKISDEDIMKRDAVAGAERRKTVAHLLHDYASVNGPFNLDLTYYQELQEFQFMDELVYTAYFKLGLTYLESVKYQIKGLKKGLLNSQKGEFKESETIAEAVYYTFCQNQTITSTEAKTKLQSIYDEYSANPVIAVGTDIKIYFETTELHNIKRGDSMSRGYKLREPKQLNSNKLINPNAHLTIQNHETND